MTVMLGAAPAVRGSRRAPAPDLAARIRRLEAQLARLRQQQAEELLGTIAGVVGTRVFSARELWMHAQQVSPALRDALDQAGLPSTRHVGKWLARLARRPGGGGLQLEQVGADWMGAIWRLSVPPDTQVGPCASRDADV